METKELKYERTLNVKFLADTKFNKTGDVVAVKTGVASKLLAAGIVKEAAIAEKPVVKKEESAPPVVKKTEETKQVKK